LMVQFPATTWDFLPKWTMSLIHRRWSGTGDQRRTGLNAQPCFRVNSHAGSGRCGRTRQGHSRAWARLVTWNSAMAHLIAKAFDTNQAEPAGRKSQVPRANTLMGQSAIGPCCAGGSVAISPSTRTVSTVSGRFDTRSGIP
jgi:hypothetical protein